MHWLMPRATVNARPVDPGTRQMTDNSPFPAEVLGRLADQVEGGVVTFFVGAGFSLDSEGNSANRLIRRLLARTLALFLIAQWLVRQKPDPSRQEALATLRRLRLTFFSALRVSGADIRSKEMINALAREYYPANDWLCTAMGQLYTLILSISPNREPGFNVLNRLHKLENVLVRRLGVHAGNPTNSMAAERVALPQIDITVLGRIDAEARGKILFLEAMGFNCRAIMAGDVDATDLQAVSDSFLGRIRRRHHVLARLAREGLSPHLLTTNFDLLLEGAYRIAGFLPAEESIDSAQRLPVTRTRQFARIVGPTDFASKANSRCPVSIVKIHGCADRYRTQKKAGATSPEDWKAILDSIVFTYREVQNWRKDAWSRDLVYTLVRSRTVVFLGYSMADPVVHDTFRNAYEEMAHQSRRRPGEGEGTAPEKHDRAPAYFFSSVDSREFHGIEILRAASRAAGVPDAGLEDHPNYVGFHYGSTGRFPDLDETLAWVLHRVYRLRQRKALITSLRGVLTALCGGPVRQSFVTDIIAAFDGLVAAEGELAKKWVDRPDDRLSFERMVSWTETFHPMLLRCFAMAEMVIAHGGPQSFLGRTSRQPWYYPCGENLAWTAWAVVVELAIRHRVASRIKSNDRAFAGIRRGQPWIRAIPAEWPTLDISAGGDHPLPLRLELRYPGFQRAAYRPLAPLPLRRTVQWDLPFTELPWPAKDQSPVAFPPAKTLLAWALGHDPGTEPEGMNMVDLDLGLGGMAHHAA